MGTFLEALQAARREMRAYGEDVLDVAAKQIALLSLDPRVTPTRPPSPSPGVAAGGGGPRPFVRSDRVAAQSPPVTGPAGSSLPFGAPGGQPAGAAAAVSPAIGRPALGLPGIPGTLWTDPRTGKAYILGPYGYPDFRSNAGYGILPVGTSSSGGGAAGAGGGSAGIGDVLPPGFTRDTHGNVVPADIPPPTTKSGAKGDRVDYPASPTPGDQLLAGKLDRLTATVRDGRPPAISRGEALLAAKMDKLIGAVRDSGRFDLRAPL